MKSIRIKSIRFVNFKGLRSFAVTMDGQDTDIAGDNGLGKSTIFDGFTWVLFGKDRKDRKQFGIKTLDENNRVIDRIPHEVEVVLNVDGEEVKLTRRYNEVWRKQRGAAAETFIGHEEERLYNGVPCSLSEWNAKINDICPEQVFKFITNPMHFVSQKPEMQRQMLLRMAGGVDDAEIAAKNTDFAALLASITGKTMDEYKREIAANKRRIKVEISELPGRIDERLRDASAKEDWAALEKERADLIAKRADLQQQLADGKKAAEAQNAEAMELFSQQLKVEHQIAEVKRGIAAVVLQAYNEKTTRRTELLAEYDVQQLTISRYEKQKAAAQAAVEQCTAKREELIAEYRQLTARAADLLRLMNTEPTFSETDFVCPTCGHPFDYDRITEIRANAIKAHADKYAAMISDNNEKIEANKRKGRANNEEKQTHLDEIIELDALIATAKNRIAEIESEPLFAAAPTAPNVAAFTDDNDEVRKLEAKLKELDKQIAEKKSIGSASAQNAQLQTAINDLSQKAESLSIRLSKRADEERNAARIAQLEEQLKAANVELANLEGIEFTIQEFSKARIEAVEQKINALFSLVRFKMFGTQVNGAEVETCEAMVGGVPFSDLNDAARINAGLDIINAICKFEQVCAPIFIDNAESINRPIATMSQRIRLIVTKDHELKIKRSETSANDNNLFSNF